MTISSLYPINGFLALGRHRPAGLMAARVKATHVATIQDRSNRLTHRVDEAFTYRIDGQFRLAARYRCGESSNHVVPIARPEHHVACERCEEVHAHGDEPWQVYVHLSSDGRALYVGQTSNLTMRRRQHAKSSPWWPEVATHEVISRHATKPEALAAEAAAIHELTPIHNIRHNRKRVA